MKKWLICAILNLSCLASSGAAEVEGFAVYENGGIDKARLLAVKDALYQAALNSGAFVDAKEGLNRRGELEREIYLSPAGSVKNYTVLREWTEGGLFHVRLDVKPSEASRDAAQDEEKTRLRRKITASKFKINFRPVDLIPNVRSGFPEELLRRLEASDEFLASNPSVGTGYPPLKANPDALSSTDDAREIAFKTGSQFVLSGVIDAGVGRADFGRWIEVEIDVYDGLTGILIAQRRHGMAISGAGEIETGSLFGSARFFSTPFGQRFNVFMKSLVEDTRKDLRSLPFMANITDIDNRKVYVDAGAVSHVEPGDKFMVYHSGNRPQSEAASNKILGYPTVPVASLVIKQVFPLFSIGELSVDAKKIDLRVGDFVNAKSVSQKTDSVVAK
ncbi:MAG: flagellar assembly protein T N-terminal domain-containing protein [Sulfuricella sp.]|nr:flagellar assembly protein T N-terminal domain-containing protein [Sulfuricella sp.]